MVEFSLKLLPEAAILFNSAIMWIVFLANDLWDT